MPAYISPKLYVDGQWISERAQTTPVVDPATGEVVGEVPHATIADLDRALESAARGFATWSRWTALKRYDLMMAAAALLRERARAIGEQMTLENGKPYRESVEEVIRASHFIEWDAGEGRRAYGQVVPGEWGQWRMALRQPIGPVAGFTPWNFPISSPARKVGAALGAGCSIILKASEDTPAAAVALVQAFVDAGLPNGAINLVFGDPAQISAHLIASPVIRALSFTGSVPVGKHLASLAGAAMKPVVMELGGHAPVIVGEGTDAQRIGQMAAAAKFRNAGQICTSPTRFIVHDSVHDTFVRAFAEAASALKLGNGFDDGVQMGPVVSQRRFDAIRDLIADAVGKGAKLACGGDRIGSEGYFIAPTVLTDVPPGAELLNVEPFGPVAPVSRYTTLDDAVTEANRLPYGLFAYVFSDRQNEVYELVHRIESGMVSVNNFGTSQPDTPFGGVKDSGHGREGGSSSLDGYMVTRFVSYKTTL